MTPSLPSGEEQDEIREEVVLGGESSRHNVVVTHKVSNGFDRTIRISATPNSEMVAAAKGKKESGSADLDLPPEDQDVDPIATIQSRGGGASAPPSLAGLRDLSSDLRLKKVIGRGGQGEVWEALQLGLGRTVAVKKALDEGGWQEFLREACTAAQLDHPNIVPVYDLGAARQGDIFTPVLAMKKVVGRSWRESMAIERMSAFYSPSDFLTKHLMILLSVINGVAYAHAKGIIHRDLKPGQVMIGDFGEVFLLDWGLAIYLEDRPSKSRDGLEDTVDKRKVFTLNTATNPAGTPGYMAPEQTKLTVSELGFHTDIYLLGSIMYEVVTGYPPHDGRTLQDVLSAAEKNEFAPLPTSTPSELAELINACLATDPFERPQSALEVRWALESYLTGATRKDTARHILADLQKLPGDAGYEEISRATQRLSQAEHLWPENPELHAMRVHLLSRFVEAAIAGRDFLVAQLQASRIGDELVSAQLQSRIEQAQAAAAAETPIPPLLTARRLTAIIATWVFIIAATVSIITVIRRTVIAELKTRVESIAASAAKELSAADLARVDQERRIDSRSFQRIFNRLVFYRQANPDVRFIYAYRPEFGLGEQKWRVLVDADPLDIDLDGDGKIGDDEKGSPPGDIYHEGVPEMREAFEDRTETSAFVDDSWGSFVSGFSPVLDPQTKTPVAVVGVDIKRSSVDKKTSTISIMVVGAALFLASLLTFTFFAFFRSLQLLQRQQQLEEALKRQNLELRRRGLFLG